MPEPGTQPDHSHKKVPHLFFIVSSVAAVGLAALLYVAYERTRSFRDIALFGAQGVIAVKEYNLMIIATLLMLIVVIPVFVFTFFIVWKYRAGKNPKHYNPEWDHSELIESIWWTVPCLIIIVLSVIVWNTSHSLDPYRPLDSDEPPFVIQAVALDWKWLFIYPSLGIATVNMVEFPAGRPIDFKVSADAPMNSLWIPELGGQIYAMPGMSTELHLQANNPGTYNGFSANISGTGFAGMKFTANSVTNADFDQWVESVRQSPLDLTQAAYDDLAKPSQNEPVTLYANVDGGLYNGIVMKYMMPPSQTDTNIKVETIPMKINATNTDNSKVASSSTDQGNDMLNMPGMNMQSMPSIDITNH